MAKQELTKKLMADTLKELSKSKSLKSITINDIVSSCGISRHTFYYHFLDRQDLINWIYKTDITDNYQICSKDNWSDNVYRALQIIWDNKSFYVSAMLIDGQNSLPDFICEYSYKNFMSIAKSLVSAGIHKDDTVDFACRFYSYAYTKMVVDWIQGGTVKTPAELLECFVSITEKGFFESIIM